MKTPKKYREDAEHCRELLDRPVESELRIQLRLWAAEFDDMADGRHHLASRRQDLPLPQIGARHPRPRPLPRRLRQALPGR